ncbi:hypothetical protein [Plantactinospora sp. KLBMP9567]|uniref:hypothetical protein n=1 Tax=Plantactinospora sp. KLBMP9567 TaxID=3085900 RepID=UPI0029817821|nr:hypothetical protein [Plantactinospora sp. KLBMP9567]MDW5327853.1 hypothetical protein [Plantactinospora sp. KLBMP9567]
MRVGTFRDLSFFAISRRRLLVSACDAAGGIGAKPDDFEQASPVSVGYFCMRVALFELLTVNAAPCSVSCTLSVEREPTARRLLDGINQQLREENLIDSIAYVISSENNFPTLQTSLGVTATGLARRRGFFRERIREGDQVVQLGECLVGGDARVDHPQMIDLRTVRFLMRDRFVHEVIPIGSGGVEGETAQLAARGVSVAMERGPELRRSGGPATAALVVASPRLDVARFAAQPRGVLHVRSIGRVTSMERGRR